MFGRLDENTDLEREYMIVSDFVDEDPIVFTITATPENIKEAIKDEIQTYAGVSFSVYELVEHAVVESREEVIFVEDWPGMMAGVDEQENQ